MGGLSAYRDRKATFVVWKESLQRSQDFRADEIFVREDCYMRHLVEFLEAILNN